MDDVRDVILILRNRQGTDTTGPNAKIKRTVASRPLYLFGRQKTMDMLPSTQNMHTNWEEDNGGNFSAGLYNIRRRWDQTASPTVMMEKWKKLTETAFQPDYYELIRRTA